MNDMALPNGQTCGDCHHFRRCEGLFQCKPTSIECDWSPSRFRLSAKAEAATLEQLEKATSRDQIAGLLSGFTPEDLASAGIT